MKKIGVFIPDWFWSSIPHDGLPLLWALRKFYGSKVDLLMFGKDIRLNKKFTKKEKFSFAKNEFVKAPNLVKLKNWGHLFKVSKQYELIACNVHLAPKNRKPEELYPGIEFKNEIQCKWVTIDVGGSDLLVNLNRADYFCVKGEIWKTWLVNMGVPKKNVFVTGTPHYDHYYKFDIEPSCTNPIEKGVFLRKYKISKEKKLILVAPCNPASHQEQFESNIEALKTISKIAEKENYKLIIKTYPHDYVYQEVQDNYTGVYKRPYRRNQYQYEIIQEEVPESIVIQSQDHFAAMLYADKLFNISGSHIAWETYFTKANSYSMNYKGQPYYSGAKYLPDYVKLPDEYVNVHIKDPEELFGNKQPQKAVANEYFCREWAVRNIVNVIRKIVDAR